MKFQHLAVLISFGAGLVSCSVPDPQTDIKKEAAMQSKFNMQVMPPVAKKVAHVMEAHGYTRTDNYYWMRDDDRKNVEVLDHLEEENAYRDAVFEPIQSLKNTILDEMINRIEKDDSSVPVLDNGYWYYRSYEGGQEYPVHARKKEVLSAPEEILLDGNEMAKGHEYFSIGDVAVSSNNEILAYTTDTLSRRNYDIEFINLVTGQKYQDKLSLSDGNVVWADDNKTVFYVKNDPQTLLGDKVYRHVLGTPQSEDVLVYEEQNKSFYTWLSQSLDKQDIYINHYSTESTGVSIIKADDPNQAPQVFFPLEDGHEYSIEKLGDSYFVHTNKNALNFMLMKVEAEHARDFSQWKEVIAHRENVYLQDVEVFAQHLVIAEKINGSMYVRVSDLTHQNVKTVEFDDDVFVASFTGNTQQNASVFRLRYSSMTTPSSVYDIDLNSFEKTLRKQTKVLGDFSSSNYKSERIFATARDGKQVPITLLYRKDLFEKSGKNPLYQYGYGSYGSTIEPWFRSSYLSLADRGFVMALAHVRGGQMMGRPWYEDGKMANKMNTFNDFIDVTRHLVAEKYADGQRVYASGGSAGGLLMGGVVNMAPELYHGVVADVPFVDVLTTMSDASIPLTTNEYDEWGNPANKSEYEVMATYSPYDLVEAKSYPHMLVTTGLFDSQVQYFEPMKWVAKLREFKTDNNVLVLDTDMESGHGGASGRFKRQATFAQEYAFISYLAGIEE